MQSFIDVVFDTILYIVSIPARLKGMKLGKKSYLGPGYDWMFVRLEGVTLEDCVAIGKNAWIQVDKKTPHTPSIIHIKKGTNIGRNATISAVTSIVIGEKCLISYNASIVDHDHNTYDSTRSPMDTGLVDAEPIRIGDHCFIGAHSFILKGVTLGKHCVVGANSVVTKSFPAYSVIAGNPAQLLKKIP